MSVNKLALTVCALFVSVSAAAQTTVTTGGGTSGSVPIFTGTATLGNSVITQQNSNIGIGTSTPSALFSVGSGSPFQVNAAGLISSTGGMNLVTYLPGTVATGINSVVVYQPSLSSSTGISGYASSNFFNMAPTGTGTNTSPYFGVQSNHFKQTAGTGTQTTAYVEADGFEVGGGSTSYGSVAVDSASANLYNTSANISSLSLFNGIMSWNGGGYTGTLTNLYGLYLGAMTGATNNYAIYSAGGTSYFAGSIGIGTATPGAALEVKGGIKLSASSGGSITFADGTTQSTAGVAESFTGTTPLAGSLSAQGGLIAGAASPALLPTMTGAVTIASSAADGQGSASHGLLFVDDTNGAASAWTHAAIYTVGASGYNGNLVFATDGDNESDFGVTEKMRITSTGSVGIGTSTPGAMLEVHGNVKLTAGSGASVTYQDGTVQTTAWNGVLSGGDYAESVDVIGDRTGYEPGDVLVIDPASKGKFSKSSEPYSTAVMGIYSTRPGVVGRRQKTDRTHMKDEIPMAMVGVVPTKVTTENGAIRPGDLLVTSSRPGYAMKGSDRSLLTGAIIGKALEPLDDQTGIIEVAVSIQ